MKYNKNNIVQILAKSFIYWINDHAIAAETIINNSNTATGQVNLYIATIEMRKKYDTYDFVRFALFESEQRNERKKIK